jgi:adenylate cyclase class 2
MPTNSRTNLEVEIKLRLSNGVAAAHETLSKAGFRVIKPRTFESNILFDTPAETLRKRRQLIRIRRVGPLSVLTYKGAGKAGKHKSREELETLVADPGNLETILLRLGYAPAFRYEKFRTEYRRARESGIVTIDETPAGNFLEIEGAPRWIDRTARQLGFAERQYITQSYGSLYQAYREAHPRAPKDMIFAAKRKTS